MRNFIQILLTLAFLSSCFNSKRAGHSNVQMKIERDSHGHIVSEIPYLNDSTIHGVAKYFNRITYKVQQEVEFKNGKKDGTSKQYDYYGNVILLSYFQNDLQHGPSMRYYSNGNLEEISYWFEGRAIGEAKRYFEDGKLKLLCLKDFDEKIYYSIQYDSTGKLISEDGVVFSPHVIVYPNVDSLFVNDSVNVHLMVASLENRFLEIVFEYSDTLFTYKPIDLRLTHQRRFTRGGEYYLKIKGKMLSEEGDLLKENEIMYEFKVYQ